MDATQARLAELQAENEALRRAIEAPVGLLSAVLDAIGDPVLVKDRQHRFLLVNQAFCEFVGIAREALLGTTDLDHFPPEQAAVFVERDEGVFETGQTNINEERLVAADGHDRVISTKKTRAYDADGSAVIVGIIRDLTEIRRTREELELHRRAEIRAEEANAAKSRFLANMSHELRTPLNGIRGYTELLAEELDDAGMSDHSTYIDQVLTATGHLQNMVDAILDLSRIESGYLHLDPERLQLRTAIDRSLATVQPAAIASSTRIEVDAPAIEVEHDARSLVQILVNLLGNAVKFAPGSTVRVRARLHGAQVRLSVSDSGPGIAPDDREHVFDKFFRAPTVEKDREGTGLGLPIARELARAMGGDLTVDDSAKGGAVFTLVLPLIHEAREERVA
ncbi:MAG: PAS domain-containing sensor histidine kinase [Myxococcota bacterium]